MLPSAVLDFWFGELSPKDHFKKDPELDKKILHRFGEAHRAARQGECFSWRLSTEGRLAEVIMLDQFSRNMFRDQSEAFAYDLPALILAQEMVALGLDQELPAEKRAFVYLPYMHSESTAIHEMALRLFAQKGLESNLDFERRHKAIIDRFGRFPHRNKILGRPSTPEETEFLRQPGSEF